MNCRALIILVFFSVAGLPGIIFGCSSDATAESLAEYQPNKENNSGPIVAKVGGFEIRLADVPILAETMLQINRSEGFLVDGPADSFEDQLQLAIEFAALSLEAEQVVKLDPDQLKEQTKKVLTRIYLNRLSQEAEKTSISEEMLDMAYEAEKARYLMTGESEVYRASRVDGIAIVVGYFPNLLWREDEAAAVLSRDVARVLAEKISAACGEQVADLDNFFELGRRFMAGNPTVQMQEYRNVVVDSSHSKLDPSILQALVALEKNGSVSRPIETDSGIFIIRRGVFYPGLGEQFEDVREQLTDLIRGLLRKTVYSRRMAQLFIKYSIEIHSELLSVSLEEGSSPR
ncbi:MAG: hypothetical protein JRJ19_03280 [Deltaproteobacteria bacterium]|nr:hypothetical protein [Deltaproteobacteria bacterium]